MPLRVPRWLLILLIPLCAGLWACTPNLDGTWHGTAELVDRKTGEPVEPAPEVTLELTQDNPPSVRGTLTFIFDTSEGPLKDLTEQTFELFGMADRGELELVESSNGSEPRPQAQLDFHGLQAEVDGDRMEGRVTLGLITEEGMQAFVGPFVARQR